MSDEQRNLEEQLRAPLQGNAAMAEENKNLRAECISLLKANADNQNLYDRGMAVTLTAVWAAINGKSNDLAEINEPMARRIDSILAACTILQETAEKRGDRIAELEAANAEIIKACRGAYVAALRPVDDGSLDCIRESLGAVIRAPQATGTVNDATMPVGDSEGRETGDGQAEGGD